MKVSADLRNQYTTLDATKAKNRVARLCERCGTGIDSRKRFCGPCYDVRLMERTAANRHKYQNKKRGDA